MALLLFESLRPVPEENQTFYIDEPELILETSQLAEVPGVLKKVEQYLNSGYIAAGFLCYEAGYAFLPHLLEPRMPKLPLIWFALARNVKTGLPSEFLNNMAETVVIDSLALNEDLETYTNAILKIKDRIERGDTYQVNYTIRYTAKYKGSPRNLYNLLRTRQKVNYASYIETPKWAICSLSPELFFRTRGRNIVMRPMKGTAHRGRTLEEDETNARELSESVKERSENLMIVDLLRNDLGRICDAGTVRVSSAMNVEKYETLLQMTSTIEGRLSSGILLSDILKAAFPSGSITGAPKISTMNIIHQLETAPRGIYTGAIGFCSKNESVFNVAIRTVHVDRENEMIEMGTGSGILYEADPAREYQECELKGQFLTAREERFDLFETILWAPAVGYERLTLHLDRIESSANYFLFQFDRDVLLQQLKMFESELTSRNILSRVRVFATSNGKFRLETAPLEPLVNEPQVCLSGLRTNSRDRFLFHKTTHRDLYDSELKRARERGMFDVLFLNEKDQLTEGAITNVYVEKNKIFYTSPVKCGLLAGTFRKSLLESGTVDLREQELYKADLLSAEAVYVSNALRGLIKVKLVI